MIKYTGCSLCMNIQGVPGLSCQTLNMDLGPQIKTNFTLKVFQSKCFAQKILTS